MNLTSQYWNNRYLTDDFGWDLGSASTPIKEYIDQLTDKSLRILIPGAGNGYEAEYLLGNGFKNVHLLDYAEEPLQNFKNRVPDFPTSHLHQEDFFSHKGQYDLIIEQTFFCALDPSLRGKYVLKMHQLLNPGGKLVGLLFDDKLNGNEPPFGGSKEEYLPLFSRHFVLKTFEKSYNSIKPRAGRELFINFVREVQKKDSDSGSGWEDLH
jgi:SAM-dependent methyltransferase